MARRRLILAGLLASASPAWAGEVACHFEGGVVVVPAEVAGIAGDFILDTGTAATTLHADVAGGYGIDHEATIGRTRLAGVLTPEAPILVAGLDLRTWNLPTPVAGVIGADLLRRYVVDVSSAPCRVRLSEAVGGGGLPGRVLPIRWDAGRPVAAAAVSDGRRTLYGPFVLATGANAPVRLADDLAQAPGAAKPAELYPDGVWLARLTTVSFGGQRAREAGAGLMKPEGAVAGVLGGQVLARYRLRFDFPAGRLTVSPAR